MVVTAPLTPVCSLYLEPVYVTSPQRHISLCLTALQSSGQGYYLKKSDRQKYAFTTYISNKYFVRSWVIQNKMFVAFFLSFFVPF